MVPLPERLILVLGGARSGKSSFAERLVARYDRVLYVATAEALDEDMKGRIAAHQAQRPAAWDTLEEPRDLVSVLPAATKSYDACLLDCVTLWVSNLLLAKEGNPRVQDEIVGEARALVDVADQSSATWVVVSNEVGLGVVPPSVLGARYRDALGKVNQLLAARADRVYFMVAGLALELKQLGALPFGSVDLSID